jgi:glutamate-1-semialdehyde 2,1-aminomutase
MMTLFFGKGPIRNFQDAAACNTELFARYHQGMLQRGIYLAPSAFEATFVSLAHTDKEIDEAVDAAAQVLSEIG